MPRRWTEEQQDRLAEIHQELSDGYSVWRRPRQIAVVYDQDNPLRVRQRHPSRPSQGVRSRLQLADDPYIGYDNFADHMNWPTATLTSNRRSREMLEQIWRRQNQLYIAVVSYSFEDEMWRVLVGPVVEGTLGEEIESLRRSGYPYDVTGIRLIGSEWVSECSRCRKPRGFAHQENCPVGE